MTALFARKVEVIKRSHEMLQLEMGSFRKVNKNQLPQWLHLDASLVNE